MRTRSPALSDSTSASLSGGATSLIPSAAVVTLTASLPGARGSQRDLLVPMRVTLDGDGDGQGGDVAGVREDVDAERRRVAAVALGADPQPVRSVEKLLFERVDDRIGVRRAELTEERLLRQERGLLERPADADAQDERRARVGAGRADALEDPLLHAGRALGGR